MPKAARRFFHVAMLPLQRGDDGPALEFVQRDIGHFPVLDASRAVVWSQEKSCSSSMPLRQVTMARSITFSSSRTLPGQSCAISSFSAAAGDAG